MHPVLPLAARQRWFAHPGRSRPDLARADDRTGVARALRCTRCGQVVTTAARLVVDGAVEHSRVNPGGFLHRFACYGDAPGCVLRGPASTEASWFPGTSWRLAECAGCRIHLGWWFAGADRAFFGLLVDRLVEREPDA